MYNVIDSLSYYKKNYHCRLLTPRSVNVMLFQKNILYASPTSCNRRFFIFHSSYFGCTKEKKMNKWYRVSILRQIRHKKENILSTVSSNTEWVFFVIVYYYSGFNSQGIWRLRRIYDVNHITTGALHVQRLY